MKLISCYIENFGGLSGYSLGFSEGLTVVCEPNGFGKTTLAEFIRVMFYGFPRKTRTGLGKKEKYQPWNGGKYGGHLTFEEGGRRYRIERGFGQRETFNLIDLQTGKKSADFSKNIGQELFGLDAESFERSTYLPQERQTGPMATDSIRAKLAGLVEDTGDVGNYQKAQEALDRKRKFYLHRTGTGGAVAEDIRQISQTQTALTRARQSREALSEVTAQIDDLTAEREKLDGELRTLRAEITAAAEMAARQAHQRHYAALEEARREAEGERTALLAAFPGELPTAAACADAGAALEELAALENRQIATAADDAARRFTEENSRRFGGGGPDPGELAAMGELCARRARTAAALAGCAPADEDALEEARRFLAPGVPEEEVLERHQTSLELAKTLRRQNKELAIAPRVAMKKDPAFFLMLLGVLLAAVGIVLAAVDQIVFSLLVLVVSILALVAAARQIERSHARGLAPEVQALIRGNNERAHALETDVLRFTCDYCPGDPAQALALIRRHAAALKELTAENDRRIALKGELAFCDEKLKAFFLGWGMAYNGDPRDLLENLRRDWARWENAGAQLADLEARQRENARAQAGARRRLADFQARYGVVPRDRREAQAMQSGIWKIEAVSKELEKLTRQMAQYRQACGEALEPCAPGTDPDALNRRERALQARLGEIGNCLPALELEARNLRAEAEAIPELEDSLGYWQGKRRADEKSAALLDETKDFLARARENLATAYMGPIRHSFATLMERMLREEQGRILVTEDLDVYLERFGESRALAAFSAGQTDLIRLCMRLALVDALFRDAKPFVILDDPFVNLDDAHLEEALALLKELSRDRQILYLTCHSGRA